jgi:hypothetical protein
MKRKSKFRMKMKRKMKRIWMKRRVNGGGR